MCGINLPSRASVSRHRNSATSRQAYDGHQHPTLCSHLFCHASPFAIRKRRVQSACWSRSNAWPFAHIDLVTSSSSLNRPWGFHRSRTKCRLCLDPCLRSRLDLSLPRRSSDPWGYSGRPLVCALAASHSHSPLLKPLPTMLLFQHSSRIFLSCGPALIAASPSRSLEGMRKIRRHSSSLSHEQMIGKRPDEQRAQAVTNLPVFH